MRVVLKLALLAALAAGVAEGRRWLARERVARVTEEARVSAERRVLLAQDALTSELERMRLVAGHAAADPRLVTEDDAEKAAALEALAASLGLEVALALPGGALEVAQSPTLAAAELGGWLEEARRRGSAQSAFARTGKEGAPGALVVAAAPLPPASDSHGWLVVGRVLDARAFAPVAARAGAPVWLADARHALAGAAGHGSLIELERLRETIEGRRPRVESETFTVAVRPLGGGFRVATVADGRALDDALARRDDHLAAGAAGILLLVAVVAFWPRRRRGGEPTLVTTTVPRLEESIPRHQTAEIGPAGPPRLGRYVLLEKIGEGGMAEIFTAVALGAAGFQRRFVIKRLRAEMAENPEAVAHFVDEATLAASLSHRNIVAVLDFGHTGTDYFIAEEYLSGRDLGRLTKRLLAQTGRTLSPVAVLHAAVQILNALACVHDHRAEDGTPLGLVHRDVSPGNIMIGHDGEVKLLDFGIVKSARAIRRTDLGFVKGNPDFMAPEQALGWPVDRRSDLYALALSIVFALTGEPLFRGATVDERLRRAAEGVGPDERARLAQLPAPLDAILSQALAADPGARFEDAAAFRDAIVEYSVGGAAELVERLHEAFGPELRSDEERLAAAIARARAAEDPNAAPPRLAL